MSIDVVTPQKSDSEMHRPKAVVRQNIETNQTPPNYLLGAINTGIKRLVLFRNGFQTRQDVKLPPRPKHALQNMT